MSGSPISYRGYEITPGPGYTKDSAWQYVHKDYDGPEDNRCGTEESIEACKEAIDDRLDDELDELVDVDRLREDRDERRRIFSQ